jgi:hypothetical protein
MQSTEEVPQLGPPLCFTSEIVEDVLADYFAK